MYSVQSSPATTASRPWWFVEYSDDGNAIGKNGKVKPSGGGGAGWSSDYPSSNPP